MDCQNCENVKLDKDRVCSKCKLKLCAYCEERMFDHSKERMCDHCDIDYCQVCYQYLCEGTNGLCRRCLTNAAEEYIRNNTLN